MLVSSTVPGKALLIAFSLPVMALIAPPPFVAQTVGPLECTVWDPNDSYINARTSPNGSSIMAKLPNGSRFVVVGIRDDERGRPWIEFSLRGARSNYVLQSLTKDCKAE